MNRLAIFALLALAACSPNKQPEGQQTQAAPEAAATPTAPVAAPAPKTKAEALLFKYTRTWPGHEAATGPYAPRDECGALPGADDFRLALAKAVTARDADALIKLVDPHVRLDFGEGSGADLVRKRLASPIYRLWDELDKLLPLGCASQAKDSLTVPWYFAQDFGKHDSYRIMMVIGQDVPLLAKPDKAAPVLANLSWDGVELAQGETSDAQGPFAHVTSFGGKTGYVARDKLRSLLAYRLLANRTDAGWQITGLVAGD